MLSAQEIYDAVLDDGAYRELPSRLAEATHARSVMIHCRYADSRGDVVTHSGYFTDEQLIDYSSRFAAIDPWAAVSARLNPAGRVMNLEQLLPADAFMQTAFYNEYIRAMGDDTSRCMGLHTHADWGSAVVAVQRGHRQGTFSDEEVAGLARVGEHLRRMLALRARLSWYERRLADVEAVLSALGEAAVMLDGAGRVLHANEGGERLLRKLGVQDDHGSVQIGSCRRTRSAFADAVEAAGDPRFLSTDVALEADNLVLTVSPLRHASGPRVMVLAKSGGAQPDAQATLTGLFKLTAAEASIALMLADGKSVNAISERRQVSVGTVRAQLKAIFEKLGCHRQAEVVALIQSLPRSTGSPPPSL